MANLNTVVSLLQRALDAVMLSFSPPPTATAAAIRWNGMLCILVGMLSVSLCAAVVIVCHAPPASLMIPSALAYAFFTVGGYRVIRGKEPAPSYAGEVSFSRVLLGCVSVIFCFSLLIAFCAVASMIFEK
jgi:hypothetical protein